MVKANVFDIQRASFVDGPGIRTVVFFKGCNLRCTWCHNPESWETLSQQAWYENRCVKCGHCISICPAKAIRENYITDMRRCIHCSRCIEECPAAARKFFGAERDIEELLTLIAADKEFYDTSNGGVTFSGGECLLQAEALEALLRGCKERNIHTAVDTAGNVPRETIEHISMETDLFLYDIKCVSPDLHKKLTGTENARILDNYRRIQALDSKKIMVRIPVIPFANDVNDEMKKIAEFLEIYPPASVELLPYHRLGIPKAKAIGISAQEFSEPSVERMNGLKQLFASHKLDVLG